MTILTVKLTHGRGARAIAATPRAGRTAAGRATTTGSRPRSPGRSRNTIGPTGKHALCCVPRRSRERETRPAAASARRSPASSYNALQHAPGTAAELAKQSKIPVGIVDVALDELRTPGRVVEIKPGRWKVATSR